MNSLSSDLRYAFRSLRRSAGFAAVSIATLAIGVGANVAVFSAIRAVLIEDLPYHEPDRIVQLWQPVPKMLPQLFFADDVAAMQGTHAFTTMGACATTPSRESINAPGAPEQVQTTGVTRSFFSIFGVTPVAGRVFDDGDFVSGDRVAIISFRVWLSQFGGRQDAIGSVIHIDRTPWTVVGVMPASFSPGCMPRGDIGVWQPITPTPGNTRTEFYVFAHLAPAATVESAQEQLDALKESKPTVTFGAYGARVEWLGEQQAGRVRPGLLLLQGVAVLLLLLTCATLANLFLVRASSRRQELGVRSALGAGRLRLVQQLLSEAVLVAAAGGTLGVGVAVWGVPALVRSSPILPPAADLSVRLPELAVGLVLGLGTAILFGLLPAVLTSRVDVLASLKGTAQMTASRAVALFRTCLVAAEVLLAVIVLVGTALLLRSVAHIAMMPLGFDPAGIVVAQVDLPAAQYPTSVTWRDFARRLENTLGTQVGSASVTLANSMPFQSSMTSMHFAVVPTRSQPLVSRYSVIRLVGPNYFSVLRVPLVRGRLFDRGDASGNAATAIVTEAFAREFGNGEDLLNRRIRTMTEPSREFVVVGIVSDSRSGVLTQSVFPAVYVLWNESPFPIVSVAVRGDARTVGQRIREAVREVDPQLPLADLESLELKISRSEATRRFYLQMLMVFGGLAGVVAILGVYSVTRHVVSLRMRELGIRVALGARSRDIRTLLMGRGLRPIVVGLAGGLLASWWLAATLAAQSEALRFQLLFEIPAQDPIAFICAAVSVLSFSALALWVPTRVANRLDPVQVLRAE